jgi:hypothetical protein
MLLPLLFALIPHDVLGSTTLTLNLHKVLHLSKPVHALNSLLPVFKRGKTDTWLELRTAESSSSSSTVSRSAGEVRLVLEFEGPPGVAYPQQRPGVDTFDDSARVNLKAQVTALVLLLSYM